MTENNQAFLTIRITKDLRKQIRQAAAAYDVDMTTYVKRAIEYYLNRLEEEKKQTLK